MPCFRIHTSLVFGLKNISSHAHNTGSRYFLGVLSRMSDEHSVFSAECTIGMVWGGGGGGLPAAKALRR